MLFHWLDPDEIPPPHLSLTLIVLLHLSRSSGNRIHDCASRGNNTEQTVTQRVRNKSKYASKGMNYWGFCSINNTDLIFNTDVSMNLNFSNFLSRFFDKKYTFKYHLYIRAWQNWCFRGRGFGGIQKHLIDNISHDAAKCSAAALTKQDTIIHYPFWVFICVFKTICKVTAAVVPVFKEGYCVQLQCKMHFEGEDQTLLRQTGMITV